MISPEVKVSRFSSVEAGKNWFFPTRPGLGGLVEVRNSAPGVWVEEMSDGNGPGLDPNTPYWRLHTSGQYGGLWIFRPYVFALEAFHVQTGMVYLRAGLNGAPIESYEHLEVQIGAQRQDWDPPGYNFTYLYEFPTAWQLFKGFNGVVFPGDAPLGTIYTGTWFQIHVGGNVAGVDYLDIALPFVTEWVIKTDEDPIPLPADSFDGSTAPPFGFTNRWLGDPGLSESVQVREGFEELDTDSVSLTRSLPWSPGGSASIASASGAVEAVLDVEANPWLDGETVRPGDAVRIEINDALKLDGVIESAAGDLGTQTLSLSVLDKIDALTRPVVVPAWLARMSTRTGMKWAGLSDVAVIDHALAKAGFESTPRPPLAPVLMPLQGSAWMPDRPDDLVKASESANSSKTAIFDVTEWGRGLSDGDIRVKPTGAGIDFTGNLRLGVFTTTNTLYTVSETSHVRVHFDEVGLSEWIGLSFDPTKIRANYFSSGAGANLCEIPRTGDEQHVTLLIDTVTGAVTLTDGTSTATGTFTPPAWGGVEIVQAFTDWLKPMLGGIYLDQGSAALDWERTAFLQGDFEAGSANEEITAFPSFTGKAIDLLKSHSEALGSVFWLDEDGHLQWRRAKRLLNRTPVRTLTATDDLLALGWKMDTSETFSGVKFNFRPVAVDRGNYAQSWGNESVLLWQGSGLRVQGDEVKEEFFGPGANEEWFYPNLSLDPIHTFYPGRERFNFGQGSWGDALLMTEGDPTPDIPTFGVVSTQVEAFASDPKRWKLTVKGIGSGGGGLTANQSLDFKVGTSAVRGGPVAGPEIAQQWEGANLPIVRGLAKAIWSDDFVTAGNVTGDWQGLPVLEREAGEWIQNSISAQQQADWLNSLVTMRAPRLENVPIIPDFDLRLGDVVWLTDEVFSQVKLKVLVTRIDYRFSPGEADMSIGCFVIESEGI